MLDFLKILIFDLTIVERIYNNTLLKNYVINQKAKYNEFSQATYIKVYKGIYFCFYIKNGEFTKLEILLRPHYYYNDNLHNTNDFKVLDCINVLKEIKNTFTLPIHKLFINNIEFGINALSPINIKRLINQIYYHEKNIFNNMVNLPYAKISYRIKPNNTANTYKQIKYYAKGLHQPNYTNKNTFRFEIKSKQSKYINSLGIVTYADLLQTETYIKLANTLIEEFSNVLIIDVGNKLKNLNPKEVKRINKYLNPITWGGYIFGSKNTFNDNKKKYFDLLDKTENNIHTKIKDIIKSKIKELLKECAISIPQQNT